MVNEWPLVTVGELADSISDTHKLGKVQLIFLNTSDILHGKILHQTYSAVQNWPGQAKKSIQRNDILFSEIRPANGRWAYVDIDAEDFVVSTKLMVIRSRPGRILPRFLYHFLTGADTTRWLQHLAESRSGTFPQITFDQIAELELALPPSSVQSQIADFLDSLEAKIELNRRMNETLEAMARTLFKSWFVDFDPVHAKTEGRDTGLPKEIADLFPDRFEKSELGEIPEGWEAKLLPKIIEVNPARSLRKGEVAPYLDMANMPTRGHSPSGVVNRAFGSGMRFMNGDTLVARITPCLENGKTAFVDFLQPNQVGWGSTEYIVLCPKEPLPPEYAYCLARCDAFRDFAIQSMTGSSGRQRVPAEALNHFLLPVGTPPVSVAFGRAIAPLFARARNASIQSRTLSTLRDTLLPKLLAGGLQIEVEAPGAGRVLPFQTPVQAAKKGRAPEEFMEAILLAELVRLTASPQHPLGRKRRTKLAYLAHRKAEEDVAKRFLKKPAGPYSPWARYQGPESIAVRRGYVKSGQCGKLVGLLPGERVAEIARYVPRYPAAAAVAWVVKTFGRRTNDDLELLATTDFAAVELVGKGKDVSLAEIKLVLKTNKEWAPKLDRALFSDANILRALAELSRLFTGGCPYED